MKKNFQNILEKSLLLFKDDYVFWHKIQNVSRDHVTFARRKTQFFVKDRLMT